jgi:phospholipid/cholesterol/gamma-HCH transport system substrate-binding protein
MKISNETKVGVLTVIAVTLLILGFNFLKGNNVLNKTKKFYAVFPDIGSLDKSNLVKIKGLPIGAVYSISEQDKNLNGIVVTIHWTRDVNIPKNSVAYIGSGLVGSSYITIEKGDSKEFIQNGDTLQTKTNPSILGDLTSQVNPTLAKVRTAIDSLTLVLGSINKIFDPNTKNNFQSIIENLLASSESLKELLNVETGIVASTIRNMNDVTGNLKKNDDTINRILHNINTATDKFANLKIEQTLDTIHSAVVELKEAIYKINHNEGSLGMLINDKKLYDNLNKTALGLEILIDDIRTHPKRYVNFSIFGRKDKGDYLTSPAKKDTI